MSDEQLIKNGDNFIDWIVSDDEKDEIEKKAEKKKNPHKISISNVSKKLNKKIILGCIGGLMLGGAVISQLDILKDSDAEAAQLNNDKAVDVGRQIEAMFKNKTPEEQEAIAEVEKVEAQSTIPIEIQEFQEKETPVQRPRSTPQTEPVKAVAAPRYSEADLYAMKSPLVRTEEYYKDLKSITSSGDADYLINGGTPQNTASFMPSYTEAMLAAMENSSTTALPGNGEDSYVSQNMQGQKNDFFNNQAGDTGNGFYINDTYITKGTVIPAVLRSGLNTDLPGNLVAWVDKNVYDSLTGENLIIPAGSKLFATYNSNVSYGQQRVQIAWTQIERPDGWIQPLGNMPGVDGQGYSGGEGRVNNHPFQYLKAMGYITLLSIVENEFLNVIKTPTANTAVQDIAQANMNATMQWGQEIIERAMDIQPTITMKPGSRINVMVNTELSLPPLVPDPVTGKYELSK